MPLFLDQTSFEEDISSLSICYFMKIPETPLTSHKMSNFYRNLRKMFAGYMKSVVWLKLTFMPKNHQHKLNQNYNIGLERAKLVKNQNHLNSLDSPQIKKITPLSQLQLSKLKKIKCLHFF